VDSRDSESNVNRSNRYSNKSPRSELVSEERVIVLSDGSLRCSSYDAGNISNEYRATVRYQYSMEIAQNNWDFEFIQEVIAALKNNMINSFAMKLLNCYNSSPSRQLGNSLINERVMYSRKSEVLQLGPYSSDKVVGNCFSSHLPGCVIIDGLFSLITTSDDSNNTRCKLLENIELYMERYRSYSVNNIKSLKYLSAGPDEEQICGRDDVNINRSVKQRHFDVQSTKWGLISGAAALAVLAGLFTFRRCRRKSEVEIDNNWKLNDSGISGSSDETVTESGSFASNSLTLNNEREPRVTFIQGC